MTTNNFNDEFVTLDNLTPEQIIQAREDHPELISAERSANALGLPESHSRGGLPMYPPLAAIVSARRQIAAFLNDQRAREHERSDEAGAGA